MDERESRSRLDLSNLSYTSFVFLLLYKSPLWMVLSDLNWVISMSLQSVKPSLKIYLNPARVGHKKRNSYRNTQNKIKARERDADTR